MSAAAQQACPADLVARRSGWPWSAPCSRWACTVVLLGALLSAVVSPWFLLLVAFVGVNQWLFVAFGDCPASLMLTRMLHVRRAAPR